MKRTLIILLVFVASPILAPAEITLSAGGGTALDGAASPQVQPVADLSLLGSQSWVPTDRLGFFLDWGAVGTYGPTVGSLGALVSMSVDTSYLSDDFLARLSLSSLANPSTVEPFFGAASADLLLSSGGPELSVYLAPRISVVENPEIEAEASLVAGAALLLGDTLLVKPTVEGAISIPGGISSGWRVSPALGLSWYPGGVATLALRLEYARSYSSTLSTLVSGGPELPLDSWDRYSLSSELSLLIGRGSSLILAAPCAFYMKSYEAFNGSVGLGVPTRLLSIEPSAEFRVPLSEGVAFVLRGEGAVALSNNSVEQTAAIRATTHFELHLR